jgi:hypothetical protein
MRSEPIYPTDLTMLTALLDGYCEQQALLPSGKERDEAGRLIVELFEGGVRNVDDLKDALQRYAGSASGRMRTRRR